MIRRRSHRGVRLGRGVRAVVPTLGERHPARLARPGAGVFRHRFGPRVIRQTALLRDDVQHRKHWAQHFGRGALWVIARTGQPIRAGRKGAHRIGAALDRWCADRFHTVRAPSPRRVGSGRPRHGRTTCLMWDSPCHRRSQHVEMAPRELNSVRPYAPGSNRSPTSHGRLGLRDRQPAQPATRPPARHQSDTGSGSWTSEYAPRFAGHQPIRNRAGREYLSDPR